MRCGIRAIGPPIGPQPFRSVRLLREACNSHGIRSPVRRDGCYGQCAMTRRKPRARASPTASTLPAIDVCTSLRARRVLLHVARGLSMVLEVVAMVRGVRTMSYGNAWSRRGPRPCLMFPVVRDHDGPWKRVPWSAWSPYVSMGHAPRRHRTTTNNHQNTT
jgi:hypothetical protein